MPATLVQDTYNLSSTLASFPGPAKLIVADSTNTASYTISWAGLGNEDSSTLQSCFTHDPCFQGVVAQRRVSTGSLSPIAGCCRPHPQTQLASPTGAQRVESALSYSNLHREGKGTSSVCVNDPTHYLAAIITVHMHYPTNELLVAPHIYTIRMLPWQPSRHS